MTRITLDNLVTLETPLRPGQVLDALLAPPLVSVEPTPLADDGCAADWRGGAPARYPRSFTCARIREVVGLAVDEPDEVMLKRLQGLVEAERQLKEMHAAIPPEFHHSLGGVRAMATKLREAPRPLPTEPGVYAMAPVDGTGPILAGVWYRVTLCTPGSFSLDHALGVLGCLWESCRHIGGRNWLRLEVV